MGENPYKRTPQERERDMAYVARHYLRGYSLSAMTDELNANRPYDMSMSTVRRDLLVIEKRWRESYLIDMDAIKAQELARIDALEAEYWDGWRASQKDEVIVTQQKSDGNSAQTKKSVYSHKKAGRASKNRDGSVQFLMGIERCIKLRMEIFGFGGKRINVNWREEAEKAGISASDLEQQFEDMVQVAYDELAKSDESGGDTRSQEA